MVGPLRSFRIFVLALAAAFALVVSLPATASAKSVVPKCTPVKHPSSKYVVKHPWSKSKKGAPPRAAHAKPTKSYAKHARLPGRARKKR